jgi:phage-related protein
MLTRDAFPEHKHNYVVYRKTPGTDAIGAETNTFTPGGVIHVMFTPITDEATIQTYGEQVVTMYQAAVYDDTAMTEHDQVEINGKRYEIISIQNYPSFRLIRVRKV